jgi:hypothetical protein
VFTRAESHWLSVFRFPRDFPAGSSVAIRFVEPGLRSRRPRRPSLIASAPDKQESAKNTIVGSWSVRGLVFVQSGQVIRADGINRESPAAPIISHGKSRRLSRHLNKTLAEFWCGNSGNRSNRNESAKTQTKPANSGRSVNRPAMRGIVFYWGCSETEVSEQPQ